MYNWLASWFTRPEPSNGPPILYFDLYHNASRIKYNVPALARKTMLDIAAQSQANWMAKYGRLSHNGNGGLSGRVKKAGYQWSAIGENIAVGKTEREVYDMWVQSSGHFANIISDAYTEYGYANSKNANGTTYWCVVFGSP